MNVEPAKPHPPTSRVLVLVQQKYAATHEALDKLDEVSRIMVEVGIDHGSDGLELAKALLSEKRSGLRSYLTALERG